MASSPFHSGMGIRVLDVREGEVDLAMDASGEHANLGGTLHGGVIATLADTAAGLAVRSAIEPGQRPRHGEPGRAVPAGRRPGHGRGARSRRTGGPIDRVRRGRGDGRRRSGAGSGAGDRGDLAAGLNLSTGRQYWTSIARIASGNCVSTPCRDSRRPMLPPTFTLPVMKAVTGESSLLASATAVS